MSTVNRSIPVAVDNDGRSGPGPDRPEPSTANPTPRPESQEPAARPSVVQTPPIDIHENAEGLVLEADVPGASEDSIAIELEDSVLSLRADVQSTVPEAAKPLRLEYPVGSFQRTFILSDEVDRTNIKAELKGGVLHLFLPKAERAKPRRIEIQSQEG